jgi:hypothetical protein
VVARESGSVVIVAVEEEGRGQRLEVRNASFGLEERRGHLLEEGGRIAAVERSAREVERMLLFGPDG